MRSSLGFFAQQRREARGLRLTELAVAIGVGAREGLLVLLALLLFPLGLQVEKLQPVALHVLADARQRLAQVLRSHGAAGGHWTLVCVTH